MLALEDTLFRGRLLSCLQDNHKRLAAKKAIKHVAHPHDQLVRVLLMVVQNLRRQGFAKQRAVEIKEYNKQLNEQLQEYCQQEGIPYRSHEWQFVPM
jgi:hypothetical protein